LATRFGEDQRVAHLCWRSVALWTLGYPEEGITDANNALKDADEIGHAGTLLFALTMPSMRKLHGCKSAISSAIALADEKSAPFWRALGTVNHGCMLALTGKAEDAVHIITSGIAAWRSTGATMFLPMWLTHLAAAFADLGQL